MNPFSRRALYVVFGLGGVSFLFTLVLTFADTDPSEIPDHRANAHSRSAIGHRDAVELLRELDIPVIVSHFQSAQKATNGLLVVAEPDTGRGPELEALLASGGGATLYVLPKRTGYGDHQTRGWLRAQELLPPDEVARVLDKLGCGDGSIVRPPAPASLALGRFSAPTLAPLQLATCDGLETMIASSDGVLLGRLESGAYLLSDPDLLANHGLGAADNALLLVQILDELRAGGPVVFDETVHGGKIVPSLRHDLLRPPFLFASIAALLAACVLLWAATGRFGKPRPTAVGLAGGKRLLIENTAALVRHAGHGGQALVRYLSYNVTAVAHLTHAPPHLAGPELRHWLEQIGLARGARRRLAELEAEVAEVAALKGPRQGALAVGVAQKIAEWRRQMTEERA
jgi:hypothetical protein